jgi:hypothetical protein
MPFIDAAVVDTILGRLALLFLTGALGDLTVARHAASQMLAAYNIETEEELRRAAEIISLGCHVLEALSQATDPGMSFNQVLRLRGSAVSLSRESHKFQRKLDQLQRDRRAGVSAQSAEVQAKTPTLPSGTTPSRPQIDEAIGLIEFAREAIESATKNGGMTWTQSLQQRHTATRIANNVKKTQAELARRSAWPTAPEMSAPIANATTAAIASLPNHDAAHALPAARQAL